MTTPKRGDLIDFAEAIRRLRERAGDPSLPLPPPDAKPPPKPHTDVDRDEETTP